MLPSVDIEKDWAMPINDSDGHINLNFSCMYWHYFLVVIVIPD